MIQLTDEQASIIRDLLENYVEDLEIEEHGDRVEDFVYGPLVRIAQSWLKG